MFPTRTNLEEYKLFMEDSISDDGGVILESDFVEINKKLAIKTHANMNTPDINFDIHNYVFIENGNIYIFELRTIEASMEPVTEFKDMINTLILK